MKEGFYRLDAATERVVALFAATDQAFGNRMLSHLDPKGFSDARVRTVIDACKHVYSSQGYAPGSVRILRMRLGDMIESGSLTEKDSRAALDVLSTALDMEIQETPEQIIGALVDRVKAHREKQALDKAAKLHSRGMTLANVADDLKQIDRIGEVDSSLGTVLSAQVADMVLRTRRYRRSITGIDELDQQIRGLPEKSLGCVAGATGSGKSMYLVHSAVHNAAEGLNVAFATVGELSKEAQFVRMVSNMTGIPTDDLEEEDRFNEAFETLDEITAHEQLGVITVKEFTDGQLVSDISAWLEDELNRGIPIHVLYVDYADKLGWNKRQVQGGYEGMKEVYTDLRNLVREGPLAGTLRWVWTASQLDRDSLNQTGRKAAGMGNIADSIWKARIVDLMITITPTSESGGSELVWNVVKNRNGTPVTLEPIPHDFACARVGYGQWPVWWPV